MNIEAANIEGAWAPRRVLVPLDGSPVAEAVIPFVSRIARPLGLEIVLLRAVPRVTPQITEGSRPTSIVDDMERLAREAGEYLQAIADRVSADRLRVSTLVRVGDAHAEILAGARECEADLIAMTSQGRSALARLFFGTVAEAVLRRSHVPVFIVRTAGAGAGRQAA